MNLIRNAIKPIQSLFREWERYFLRLGGSKVIGFRICTLPNSSDPITQRTTVVVKLIDGVWLAKTWRGFPTERQTWRTIERWVQAISQGRIPRGTKTSQRTS